MPHAIADADQHCSQPSSLCGDTGKQAQQTTQGGSKHLYVTCSAALLVEQVRDIFRHSGKILDMYFPAATRARTHCFVTLDSAQSAYQAWAHSDRHVDAFQNILLCHFEHLGGLCCVVAATEVHNIAEDCTKYHTRPPVLQTREALHLLRVTLRPTQVHCSH